MSTESKEAPVMTVLPPRLYSEMIGIIGSLPYVQVAHVIDKARNEAKFARINESSFITDNEELKKVSEQIKF